jgi:hypothetical protein
LAFLRFQVVVVIRAAAMGSCVSTTKRRQRSRKLSATARKLRQKIIRGSGFAARHAVVHVDAPAPASPSATGVTLHLTQLQWQHSQMDAGNGERGNQPPPRVLRSTPALLEQNPEISFLAVICDEAWYDSVSMLEDSADPDFDDDDDLDNDYASVSGGNALARSFLGQRHSAGCSFRIQIRSTQMLPCLQIQTLSRMSPAARADRRATTRRAWRTPCAASGASRTRRRGRATLRGKPTIRMLLVVA